MPSLAELLRGSGPTQVFGRSDVEIKGLRHDSRHVVPGDLFFALPGAKTDGNRHVKDACARGAVAVLSELAPPPPPAALGAAWVQAPDSLAAMGAVADAFFGRPSEAMKVIGVTGTNGKTTTTYFLESIVTSCGGLPAVAGTVNHRLGGRVLEKAANTTPISLELLRLFARFRDGGATHAAMEVSSHALALKRVEKIAFDAAVFTNLSRDHLDFHKTQDSYFEAKAHLFELLCRVDSPKKTRVAALNADDPRAPALKRRCVDCNVVLYGLKGDGLDLTARDLDLRLDGASFTLDFRGRRTPARVALAGAHNVYNALASAAAALGLGMPAEGVATGLGALRAVPGRLEPVEAGQKFHVFVDYAHTDSALETVLGHLSKLPHERLITVVGCGGERDRTKRGPMGVAACAASDIVFLTNDNPRGEDPLRILDDIEAGVKQSGLKNYKILPERAEAIEAAIAEAREGDVVLIAGKGHEDYQILKDRTIHFDDRETARAALAKRS